MIPVTILVCALGAPDVLMGGPDTPPTQVGRTLNVAFRNDGDTTLDELTFVIEHGGRTYTVRDDGRFSPGATIEHQFTLTQDDPELDGEATCSVSEAHPLATL